MSAKRNRAVFPELVLGMYTHTDCIALCNAICTSFDACGSADDIQWNAVSSVMARSHAPPALWTPAACEKLWMCLAFDKDIGVAHEGSAVLSIQRGTKRRRLKATRDGRPPSRPQRYDGARSLFVKYYKQELLAALPPQLSDTKCVRQMLKLHWDGAPLQIKQQFFMLEATEKARWERDVQEYEAMYPEAPPTPAASVASAATSNASPVPMSMSAAGVAAPVRAFNSHLSEATVTSGPFRSVVPRAVHAVADAVDEPALAANPRAFLPRHESDVSDAAAGGQQVQVPVATAEPVTVHASGAPSTQRGDGEAGQASVADTVAGHAAANTQTASLVSPSASGVHAGAEVGAAATSNATPTEPLPVEATAASAAATPTQPAAAGTVHTATQSQVVRSGDASGATVATVSTPQASGVEVASALADAASAVPVSSVKPEPPTASPAGVSSAPAAAMNTAPASAALATGPPAAAASDAVTATPGAAPTLSQSAAP